MNGWTLLPEATANKVAAELQPVLTNLTDLHLVGKQAHWTVVGETFKPVHEHLDELVDAWRLWADRVAERIVTLGVVPKGRAEDIVSDSPLGGFPLAWLDGNDAAAAVADRMQVAGADIRSRQQAVADLDVISDAILQDIIEGLEQQLWMLKATLH